MRGRGARNPRMGSARNGEDVGIEDGAILDERGKVKLTAKQSAWVGGADEGAEVEG